MIEKTQLRKENSPKTDPNAKIICQDISVFVQIGSMYEAFILKMVLMHH